MVGMVAWKLGRLPRFLAKGSLFRVPVVGWFLRKSGQVPVERGGSARGAAPLQAAQQIVDDGGIVIVYPEGSLTRDPDLWPMRGKTGAARMALEHDIPVIPMAHWGTQQVMARYGRRSASSRARRSTSRSATRSTCRRSAAATSTRRRSTRRRPSSWTRSPRCWRTCAARRLRQSAGTRPQHDQKETGRFEG